MRAGARFRTLTARYPGTCQRCRRPIAQGDVIRYGGPGRTYHLADACPGPAGPELADELADELARPEHGSPRPFYGRRNTTRARGRCEDAPCCGCCD